MVKSKLEKILKKTSLFLAVLSLFFFTAAFCYKQNLPDSFLVTRGQDFSLNESVVTSTKISEGESDSYNVSLKLFGVIPIKTANVNVVDRPVLRVLGTPFGVKLLTKGVLVISLNSLQSNGKTLCPGELCGLKKGDVILSIDNQPITSNNHIASIIEKSNGNPLKVEIIRDNTQMNLNLTPVKSDDDNRYKAGIWVRDSSAGIGTATFYDPNTHVFAGLGHGICDSDTGGILSLSSGEIVDVNILGINKGQVGTPGELIGTFASRVGFGQLVLNNQSGVYGKVENAFNYGTDLMLGLKQEIKTGKAYIITTFENQKPQKFEIQIEKVNLSDNNPTKNLVIKITDPALIEKTGGIVQGMSGSPIIQDNKLVGAVTHVFVNDPTRGYGIFAENMYQTAQNTAKIAL
jgi:stage IV sporulation protein B